jgi:hypothetical protein
MEVPMLARYPETLQSGGLLLHSSGPPWLSTYVDISGPDVLQDDPDPSLNLSDFEKSHVSYMKLASVVADASLRPIIKTWAKNLFMYTALERTTAILPVPLDVSILPGKRYKVTNMKGDALFSGFLAQVSHSLAMKPKSGTAVTTLSFTHIQAGNFKLPT